MERTVTFTELKQSLRSVKQYAREDVVHVLQNGMPGYVLCSFEVWEQRMAAAARRGAYRANVEESIRESEQDEREGRLVSLDAVICLDDEAARQALVTESALRCIDLEYDGEQRPLLEHTLSELIRRPNMGKPVNIEYTGECAPVHKFFSPPCDVLYVTNSKGSLVVYGFVRSSEWCE